MWPRNCVSRRGNRHGNWTTGVCSVMSTPEDVNVDGDRTTMIDGELTDRISLRTRVRQVIVKTESEIIRETLDRHRWNRRKTAEALQISYRSLMYKMKHCKLRDNGPAARPLAGNDSSRGD